MAGSRVLVHEEIYDDVHQGLAERAPPRSGSATRRIPASEMGTVACQAQYEKVLRYIDIAKSEGATLATGGKRARRPGAEPRACSWSPRCSPTSPTTCGSPARRSSARSASLIRFTDEDDAVRIANDTPFGLAAGVWTRDVALAHRMIRKLRAGTVWINNYRKVNHVGPVRRLRRERRRPRERRLHAVDEYTEVKTAWIDTGNTIKDPFNPRA